MQPVGDKSSWAGDYRYLLGEALLVAPLLDGSGKRDVELPSGARWYDWWAPGDDAIAGGHVLADYDATAIERIPLFVREGAIIPLAVRDGVTGLGTVAAKGTLTVLVFPGGAASAFSLREDDDSKTEIVVSSRAGGARVGLARTVKTTLLRIRTDTPRASVTIDGSPAVELAGRAALDAAASGWFAEAASRSVWVKVPKGTAARTILIE